jgi:hypothetical protein
MVIWQIYLAKGKGHISMPLTDLPCSNMGKICSKKLITIVGCNFQVSEYSQQFIYHWFCGKNLSKNMEVRCPVAGFILYVKSTSEKAKHIRNHYNIQGVFRRYTSLGLCSWEKHHEIITNTAFIACSVNVARSHFDGTDRPTTM